MSDTDSAPIWYFAIGAMINPISFKARQLTAIESRPAKLLNHKLVFKGKMGMAGAKDAAGQSIHGVLHLCSPQDMAKLDNIEMSYDREDAVAECYDDTVLKCTVYKFNKKKSDDIAKVSGTAGLDMPPTERYLDVIIEGCRHFGLNDDYIKCLETHEKQPRKKVENLLRLPDPPAGVTMTKEELAAGTGLDGNPLRFSVNGKVCEVGNCPDALKQGMLLASGREATLVSAQLTYDPKYGMPSTYEEMTLEHRLFLEDFYAEHITKLVTVIASVSP